MRRTAAGFNTTYFAVLVAASLCAIFYLPYLVSPPPTASASYIFGYNNRMGILLLLVSLAAGAVFTKGIGLQASTPDDERAVPARTLVVCLCAVLLGCGFMYLLAGRFGGFGESSYEIDRTWLLSLGKTPYVDFEWPFGITFLYGPLLLRSLLGLTLVPAYYLFWTLNYLLGTWLLYAVVNKIDYPTASRRTIFLLVFTSGFMSILTMGTHYTFLRYTLPLYCILLIENAIKPGGSVKQIRGAVLAVICTVLLLTLSPETAIAFAFACACVFLPAIRQGSRSIGIYGGTLLAFAAVFIAALKLHVLDTMRASGGGADSFPIIPAPHILLFFVALFICACYLYRRLRDGQFHDNTAGLIAFSVPMLAAALGRCDPFHVTWNGEAVFLVSLFYISHYKQAWKAYVLAYGLFLVVLPAATMIWIYLPSLGYARLEYARRATLQEERRSLPDKSMVWIISTYSRLRHHTALPGLEHPDSLSLRGVTSDNPASIASLYPAWPGPFLAPFGYKPNRLGTKLSTEVDYGHYEALENANTHEAVALKLAEITHHPEKALLLPAGFEDLCRTNPLIEEQKITVLFAFPYLRRARHSAAVQQPICDTIRARYVLKAPPSPANEGYGLWVDKKTAEHP